MCGLDSILRPYIIHTTFTTWDSLSSISENIVRGHVNLMYNIRCISACRRQQVCVLMFFSFFLLLKCVQQKRRPIKTTSSNESSISLKRDRSQKIVHSFAASGGTVKKRCPITDGPITRNLYLCVTYSLAKIPLLYGILFSFGGDFGRPWSSIRRGREYRTVLDCHSASIAPHHSWGGPTSQLRGRSWSAFEESSLYPPLDLCAIL